MGITDFLKSTADYAVVHGVSPIIFLILYVASIPLYYFPLLKIRAIYKNRKNKDVVLRVLIGAIVLNRFAWALPYLYVLFFGKNLPLFIKVVLLSYMAVGTIYFVIKKYTGYVKLKGEGSWK